MILTGQADAEDRNLLMESRIFRNHKIVFTDPYS
jgi:hypothetical protein